MGNHFLAECTIVSTAVGYKKKSDTLETKSKKTLLFLSSKSQSISKLLILPVSNY